MNRRMRNRMYGGVRGRRGQPRPLLDGFRNFFTFVRLSNAQRARADSTRTSVDETISLIARIADILFPIPCQTAAPYSIRSQSVWRAACAPFKRSIDIPDTSNRKVRFVSCDRHRYIVKSPSLSRAADLAARSRTA